MHTDPLLLLAGAVAPPPPAPTPMAPVTLAATVLHVLEAALTKATRRGEPGVLLPRAFPVKDLSHAACAKLISAAGVTCKVEGNYARFTDPKLLTEKAQESYTAKYGAPPPGKVADLVRHPALVVSSVLPASRAPLQFTCALSPEHAGRCPVQKAVWLVNNGADGAPQWVWVFEACTACQKCRKSAAAVMKEAKLEEQPPGAGTGGGGAQDAGVAPLAKRQKPAACNGASPAQATAVPAAHADALAAVPAPAHGAEHAYRHPLPMEACAGEAAPQQPRQQQHRPSSEVRQPGTVWSLWVRRIDAAGSQYFDTVAAPADTVAQFKRRWVSDRRLDIDAMNVTLKLANTNAAAATPPTSEEEQAAIALLNNRNTLAEAGVVDGSWLVASIVPAP